jgi:predicted alpha-1,6-mannanase (GH76 family)
MSMPKRRHRWRLSAIAAAGTATLALVATVTPAQAATDNGGNARDRAAATVSAMMKFYDQSSGLWQPSAPWWQSGNALQALLDYVAKTGSRRYLSVAEHTIAIQRAPLPWWPSGGGDFRADSTDDTGWWALANVRMYQLTHDKQYLTIAEEDEAYIRSFWDDTSCGGGILWDIPSRSYKNAISNELYLKLTASLHNVIPGDTFYLSQALKEWHWLSGSGMINSDNLVNDGLTSTCVNNGGTTWTYNQGVILGGLAQLYQATHDRSLLATARRIADAVIASPDLSPNGILTEPCQATGDCEPNGPAFKGIFVRNLGELDSVLPGHPYRAYLEAQARSAYQFDRNSADQYGLSWAGPFDSASIARQEAAVSLLTAVLPSAEAGR